MEEINPSIIQELPLVQEEASDDIFVPLNETVTEKMLQEAVEYIANDVDLDMEVDEILNSLEDPSRCRSPGTPELDRMLDRKDNKEGDELEDARNAQDHDYPAPPPPQDDPKCVTLKDGRLETWQQRQAADLSTEAWTEPPTKNEVKDDILPDYVDSESEHWNTPSYSDITDEDFMGDQVASVHVKVVESPTLLRSQSESDLSTAHLSARFVHQLGKLAPGRYKALVRVLQQMDATLTDFKYQIGKALMDAVTQNYASIRPPVWSQKVFKPDHNDCELGYDFEHQCGLNSGSEDDSIKEEFTSSLAKPIFQSSGRLNSI